MQLKDEFGNSVPIRFLLSDKESNTTECLDCEAKSHAFELESLSFDDEKMKKLKDALLFILWKTNWPIGE